MLLLFLGRKPKDSPLRNTRNTVRKVDLPISDPTESALAKRAFLWVQSY